MVEPFAQRLRKAKYLRDAAFHEHVHVERNTVLELGELEQRLHQELGIYRTRARLDHQPDVLCRFIAHVSNERQLLLVDKLSELLDQTRLLHQPRNFADDDNVGAAAGIFLFPARTHPERSATRIVGLRDRLRSIYDNATGREVRPLDVFKQSTAPRFRIIDEEQRGVAQLGSVVRRDRGGHADRDALRTVGKQVRKRRRQHHGFFTGPIVGAAEVNRVFVDAID